MKLNWSTTIVGTKCQLVPYQHCHVPQYHEWMKDPWLQEMTASEPLSLQEEFTMQREWKDDPQKCTFIILCRPTPDTPPETSTPNMMGSNETNSTASTSLETLSCCIKDTIDTHDKMNQNDMDMTHKIQTDTTTTTTTTTTDGCTECHVCNTSTTSTQSIESQRLQTSLPMVGDINLFLLDDDDFESDDETANETANKTEPEKKIVPNQIERDPTTRVPTKTSHIAELMVMTAEAGYRRHGIAREASWMIMQYGINALGISKYVVKIASNNQASIKLFTSMGFQHWKDIPAFNESHFVFKVDDLGLARINAATAKTNILEYHCI